jgi:hypothetical protein
VQTLTYALKAVLNVTSSPSQEHVFGNCNVKTKTIYSIVIRRISQVSYIIM